MACYHERGRTGTAVALLRVGKGWWSLNSAKGLLVVDCGSAIQGTEPRRTHPRCVHCLVSTVILLSSVVSVGSPSPAWAAVYQCRDAAGKTVLTDRPRGLQQCHTLSEDTSSASTPPGSNPTPQVPLQNAPPVPPRQPADSPGAPIGSLPPLNPAAPSSPPSTHPCPRGLNPLNPLAAAPPCVRSDQSGARPPGVAPAPSQ